jgi:hypothetical protein
MTDRISEIGRIGDLLGEAEMITREQLSLSGKYGSEGNLVYNMGWQIWRQIIDYYLLISQTNYKVFTNAFIAEHSARIELMAIEWREFITAGFNNKDAFQERQHEFVGKLSNHHNSIFEQPEPSTAMIVSLSTYETISKSKKLVHTIARSQKKYRDEIKAHCELSTDKIKKSAEKELESIIKESTRAKADLEAIKQDVKKLVGETAVSLQSKHFRANVRFHELGAKYWQGNSVKLSFAILILGIVSYICIAAKLIEPDSNMMAIQLAIAKIVVFSILFSFLYICVKNMYSHKHNSVVNQHRVNALNSFKTLTDGSRNDISGDIILSHAAACIFSPQPSGYTNSDTVDPSQAGSILELLNKFSKTPSSISTSSS